VRCESERKSKGEVEKEPLTIDMTSGRAPESQLTDANAAPHPFQMEQCENPPILSPPRRAPAGTQVRDS